VRETRSASGSVRRTSSGVTQTAQRNGAGLASLLHVRADYLLPAATLFILSDAFLCHSVILLVTCSFCCWKDFAWRGSRRKGRSKQQWVFAPPLSSLRGQIGNLYRADVVARAASAR